MYVRSENDYPRYKLSFANESLLVEEKNFALMKSKYCSAVDHHMSSSRQDLQYEAYYNRIANKYFSNRISYCTVILKGVKDILPSTFMLLFLMSQFKVGPQCHFAVVEFSLLSGHDGLKECIHSWYCLVEVCCTLLLKDRWLYVSRC